MKRGGDPIFIPNAKLSDMIAKGFRIEELADHFEVSVSLIRRRIREYEFKEAWANAKDARLSRYASVKAEERAQIEARCPSPRIVGLKAVPERKPVSINAPFWTPKRDASVIKTGGLYSKINALADRWGVPATRITGRWHQLRVAL